jgi:hypothetical protein
MSFIVLVERGRERSSITESGTAEQATSTQAQWFFIKPYSRSGRTHQTRQDSSLAQHRIEAE